MELGMRNEELRRVCLMWEDWVVLEEVKQLGIRNEELGMENEELGVRNEEWRIMN